MISFLAQVEWLWIEMSAGPTAQALMIVGPRWRDFVIEIVAGSTAQVCGEILTPGEIF